MRLILVPLLLCLTAGTSHADLVGDVRACKTESDSLKRLTCFDAITMPNSGDEATGATTPASAAAPVSPTSKSTVELTSAKLRVQNKNYQRQIFTDRVELVPTFKNSSKKTVVAIAHTLSITDAFGDEIVEGESKLDIKIPPGKTVESESIYFWEDNQFIQGEPYDKLTGPVSTGTAKATLNVTKVVYGDGTSENF